MRYSGLLFVFMISMLASCVQNEHESESLGNITPEIRESLIEANKQMAGNESDEIDRFISKQNIVMTKSGTGLRYHIERTGKGKQAMPGMKATVKFRLSLLNGKLCYSSDSTGLEEFIIDQDVVESGLHEGVKLMHEGDKAKFILPSHLAHGLIGDKDCIPAKSPVIYDIELINLK